MKIVVFGLGHIGSLTMATLLHDGHSVVGVDRSGRVLDQIARGSYPFCEAKIGALIADGKTAGLLTTRTAIGDAVDADLAFICVGTHGRSDGRLDLADVTAVAGQIGEALQRRSRSLPPMLLVFRSTLLPGSMRGGILPAVTSAAGEPPGCRYDLAHNPLFTREGCALADYLAPSRIVVGERQPGCARLLLDLLCRIDAPLFTTSFEAAELVKFADNTFHALKVTFANEMARLALRSAVSPGELFDLFKADTKLNLSEAYLRPGAPFGGPCLPKDVGALAAHMRDLGLLAPVASAILESNTAHLLYLADEIGRRTSPPARVLLVGLTFKSGIDDLRESALLKLAELLLDRGYDLSIFDPDLIGHQNLADAVELSARVSAALRAEPDGDWDLVVMGKVNADGIGQIAAHHPVFHISRL